MSEFVVDCACGRKIPVNVSAAGCAVPCHCGRTVPVPPLSELRVASGGRAFESGVLDRVRRLIQEEAVALSPCCVISGRPTTNLVWVQVECERRWIRDPTRTHIVTLTALFLVSPLLLIWKLISPTDLQPQEFGRDTAVELPLSIDPDFEHRLGKLSQRKLKKLIRTVPEYSELLNEYPHARLYVAS